MRLATIARAVLAASMILAAGGAVSQAAPVLPAPAPQPPAANNTEGGAEDGAFASAYLYNGTADDGNVTTDAFSHIRCIQNFFKQKPVEAEEGERLIECYRKYQDKGQWLGKMTKCNGTRKYFQSWGHHWLSAPDCWNACKACFRQAVLDQAGNMRCFKYEGLTARCAFTYE
ncbi:hypothetical protein F4805DRAFT_477284 [Annulohypoxylon moriforme]|nr:hypothetical protein F4805DRAFT_477284 [Annulohypoxylon moriforme]